MWTIRASGLVVITAFVTSCTSGEGTGSVGQPGTSAVTGATDSPGAPSSSATSGNSSTLAIPSVLPTHSTTTSVSTSTTVTPTTSVTGSTASEEGLASSNESSPTSVEEVESSAPTGPVLMPQGYCYFPNRYAASDVRAAYDDWKATVVTSDGAGGFLRVKKPDSGSVIGSTVSEGIGYGMLLAVYMDDAEVFDGLWKYAKLHFNGNGLMDWEIHPDGHVIGSGAATDGDEDMAWALIMAARKWGGQRTLDATYASEATDLINAMWEHEIDHSRGEMVKPGDTWGDTDITNISYFAPAYYRVFGKFVGKESDWNKAVDSSYRIIEASLTAERGNANNGLVPAWCDSRGVPTAAYDGAPLHFQNDSTRTPFRVGQDYCYFGEPRAKAYMEKITSFYLSVGVSNIVDGYDLDGTPHPEHSDGTSLPASFVGPAAVGATYSDANLPLIDEAYTALATLELDAGTIYYQKSWTALSLLMLTGGFVEL